MTNASPQTYAQNILQLHTQLRERAMPLQDQAYLSTAHRLAADLFSGQTRGPGKPFLEHLVGTASILVTCNANLPLVAAGLLHAAYDQGDFGVGLTGRHQHKKAEMVRVIGAEAENHVSGYHHLRWNSDYIRSLPKTLASLPEASRRIVLIRLANELEEHLDCAIQFTANAEERLTRMDALQASLVDAAHTLGQPLLASELVRVFDENRTTHIPELLRAQTRFSHVRAPRSYARRWSARLRSSISR